MPTPTDARSAILSRIRSALAETPAEPDAIARDWAALPRLYHRQPTRSRADLLTLLEDRLRDYDAHVERVLPADLPSAIARCLAERGYPRMIAPAGLPPSLLPAGATVDTGLTHAQLDQFSGVLTEATLAIAITGTLVLQNVPGQGRRAVTLIPDYHLCLIHAADVVESVPEAIARLDATSTLPSTFVSGPSATADIEMTRIKGVHGPRTLDVLLITPA